MGIIKINNENYGSSNASDITYKNITVEEKLDTIPIFDINDNGNVDNSGSNVLTYGHIIDNLTSNTTDKVLSANQGRILNNKIDNIDLSYLEDGISTNTESINSLTNNLINLIYPVGSIYMSVNNVSPASFLGGIWEQIKDRFLLAAGSSYSAGSTGGEATHTLTTNEMPEHEHQNWYTWSGSPSVGGNWKINMTLTTVGGIGKWTHTSGLADAALTGGGAAHNNMPPYLTVYIWKRIS